MPRTDDTTTTTGELVPVKFSRLTRRGLILGLSLSQMIALGIGGASLIGALYAGGGILIAYSAPIWAAAIALTWVKTGGRALVEWIPVCAWWAWRTTGGQLAYRRRIVAPRPEGTLALPGDMARLRERLDPDTGAGMTHDPRHGTLPAVSQGRRPAVALPRPPAAHARATAAGRGP